jgi:outer membrane receptor for ferrienterochelin and colicin
MVIAKMNRTFFYLFAFLCFFPILLPAGQTGKIVGRVTDSTSKESLPGANIVLENTILGAATDLEGDFLILNLPPGMYTVVCSMLGYRDMRVTNVRISVDQSTRVDFQLQSASLELGETITVVAERPLIQKDLTATASSVGAEEIETLPVENFNDILSLQAGVVVDNHGDFHVRGGRSNEIGFLIDGVSVRDPYSGKASVTVDQGVIQELKLISGTFNAEYGQVMSGIVEVVTKDPENDLKVGGSVYAGDYLSSNEDVFYNIDDLNPVAIYNLQAYLTGPLPLLGEKLSYYLSFRKFYNEGWMYGQRRFNPPDSSSFDPKATYIEETGDNQPVPMNDNSEYYGNAKLVFKISPRIKLNYSFFGSKYLRSYYDHLYKYNPSGNKSDHEYGYTNIIDWSHTLSANTFYTLKLSYNYFDLKSYLYEDPDDPRYVNPELLMDREDAYSFLTGGTNMIHNNRTSKALGGKFDITSQITKMHQLKFGLEIKDNTIHENNFEANYRGIPGGGIFSAVAFYNEGDFTHEALEGSAYLQDKIELRNMTLNIGFRYDYFDSQGDVPQDFRNPDSLFTSAEIQHQWSPRFGIAFPISASGVVHASYGHFFQIPPYEFLYKNPNFVVAPGGLRTLMGNADLKAQSTIIYEIGFQQEFLNQIGIDVTGFYKDIRNLLGTTIYETYVLGDRYARYENLDYGNIRGITFSLNKRPGIYDHITVSFDYTFQIAEGNASDPNQEFNNQQSYPPKKSNIQVVPLNWDQRHTMNLSISYSNPRILTLGLITQFQSGLPYTPAIQSLETTFENSGRKPLNNNTDLLISRRVNLWKTQFEIFAKVYNLFDRKNEIDVYQDTGRAGYSLISHYTTGRDTYVNTLDEWINRPDYYSEPRKVFFGINVEL